jgi:hypothetical protein
MTIAPSMKDMRKTTAMESDLCSAASPKRGFAGGFEALLQRKIATVGRRNGRHQI